MRMTFVYKLTTIFGLSEGTGTRPDYLVNHDDTGTRPDYLVNRDDRKNEGPFGETNCTDIEK